MTERLFTYETVLVEGAPRSAVSVKCACGAVDQIVSTNGKRLPPEFFSAKWRRAGWKIGRNASRDRCPACSKSQPEEPMPTPQLPSNTRQLVENGPLGGHAVDKGGIVTPLRTQPRPVDVAPREMDREDRRLIFAELNDAYADPDQGYRSGHSDASIANEMQVPIAWVRAIREEMFGPADGEKTAKQITALTERYAEIEAAIADLKDRMADLLAKASTVRSELSAVTRK